MKRKILVIHNGYPLRGDGGDKVRTLNMLQSLDSIGFDVCLLAFFKKDFSLLALNKKSMPSNIKSYFIFTLPDRWGTAQRGDERGWPRGGGETRHGTDSLVQGAPAQGRSRREQSAGIG